MLTNNKEFYLKQNDYIFLLRLIQNYINEMFFS